MIKLLYIVAASILVATPVVAQSKLQSPTVPVTQTPPVIDLPNRTTLNDLNIVELAVQREKLYDDTLDRFSPEQQAVANEANRKFDFVLEYLDGTQLSDGRDTLMKKLALANCNLFMLSVIASGKALTPGTAVVAKKKCMEDFVPGIVNVRLLYKDVAIKVTVVAGK